MSAPEIRSLAVVIVLHDSAEVIEGCIGTIAAEVELIVVDNASADDGAARAAALRPDATIILSAANLGFGGGCNLGWQATRRDLVAFVNPDVRLRPDTLALLAARVAERPHTVAGPALLDAGGDARPLKRRPALWRDLLGLLPGAGRWAGAGWDRLPRGHRLHVEGGAVEVLEGACFLIARADLEAIGGFDEDFFLYYEEESIALRLGALGGRAVYEPRAAAEHEGGASTRRVAAVARRHMHRSRVVFYRKRDGELRARSGALALAAAALVALGAALASDALRRPRSMTAADLVQVLAGLRDGVRAPLHDAVTYPRSRRR